MTRNTAQSASGASPSRYRRLFIAAFEEEATATLPAINGNGADHRHARQAEEATAISPAINGNGAGHRAVEAQPLSPVVPRWRQRRRAVVHKESWKPGTFGFWDNDEPVLKEDTFPMMVLNGIAKEQGEPRPVMQSEISGAARNAGFVGVGNIISVVFKYIAVFLIQYGFGPGLYGIYTLGTSLLSLVASIFNLGLDDAMVRYTAIYRSKRSASSLKGLMIFCTALAGIAGIIGAFLLLFFTPSLATLWASLKHHGVAQTRNTIAQMTPLLQILAPITPLLTVQAVWFGGLRGFKAFKWRTLTMSIIVPLVQIILLLILLRFFHVKGGIEGVGIVLLISTLVGVALNLYFLIREYWRFATPEREQYESREWLSFASFNFLTTIIDTVLDSIDTILLAGFGVGNVELGEYGAAIRINSFIAMPLLTLNNIFAPTIAELYSKGEKKKLEVMFKVVTKWSITFSFPIFLITALFSRFLLGISGSGFVPGWPLEIAFGVGSMINAATGAVGYMLLMTGHQKLSFLNSITAVVVNIVLGIILAPRYGAMGIAVSTGLAIGVVNLMRLLQVRLFLKMHPYRRDVLKPLGAGLISAALVGVFLFLLSNIKASITLGHAILSLELLLIPVFLVSYIGLLVLFKGNPEDEIVMQAIRNKLRRGKKKADNKMKMEDAL